MNVGYAKLLSNTYKKNGVEISLTNLSIRLLLLTKTQVFRLEKGNHL